MAWTFKVNEDAGKDGVATVHAIWNIGEEDEFRYLGRVNVKEPNKLSQFATKAKNTKAARVAKAVSEASLVTLLESVFSK